MSKVAPGAAIVLAALLTACQPQPTPPESSAPALPPSGQADACGAGKLAKFVGTADNAGQRAAITATSGARAIRWITPGMPVTMDYFENRLNANIGADGRYSAFSCG